MIGNIINKPTPLNDQQFEFLKDVAKLINASIEFGYKITGGELKRTEYQQKYYVDIGLSLTMDSDHLISMALDLNVFYRDDTDKWILTYDYDKIKPLGDFWKSLNPLNVWGGDFKSFKKKDSGHFARKKI